MVRFEKIIAKSRIIELSSPDMRGALGELVGAAVAAAPNLKKDTLLKNMLQRENTMSTYLGQGVSLPHLRVKMRNRYLLTIGRSMHGVSNAGDSKGEKQHLIFMLLANENTKDYLQVLASLARLLKEEGIIKELMEAAGPREIFERLAAGFGGLLERPTQARQNKINQLMIREADRVAKGADCSAIMVFGDTFVGGIEPGAWFPKSKTILVTRNLVEIGDEDEKSMSSVLQVKSFSMQRLAQLRSAVLLAFTQGMIGVSDRICCLGGITGSNQFDTVVVVDVEKEFRGMATSRNDLLPTDLKPEVLERAIAIAMELAVEGREGKPVGCLFVLGDSSEVDKRIKPLVLNPFYGYKEEDRNVLSPFMDETIKEFSSLDGAFVIRGDGVLLSAGSLIQATDRDHNLPSGYGSRHAAAAAITVETNCIALTVSSSTRQVTMFRRGMMLPLSEKLVGAPS